MGNTDDTNADDTNIYDSNADDGNADDTNVYHTLERLMDSYVPEFAYERDGEDPGSVLATLCGRMVADSERRYGKVLHKHKVQFLNLFDGMLPEPVSAAKGYVKFHPVPGYGGDILVPAGTQVASSSAKPGSPVFETTHDMSATTAVPEVIVNTDRGLDRIVKAAYKDGAGIPGAFDVSGENQSQHRMYLCFGGLFDHLERLDFRLYIEMRDSGGLAGLQECLDGGGACFKMLEPDGGEALFDQVSAEPGGLHFVKESYRPRKSVQGGREGYYLVLEAGSPFPELYIDRLEIGFGREGIVPEEVLVNGISELPGAVQPFGSPLELYGELVVAHKEVFTKKGAEVTLEFGLDYTTYEDALAVPALPEEYKAIMRKPKKAAELPVAQVKADFVVWEYLSLAGWKRIWKEGHVAAMFDGRQSGPQKLSFRCPEDMQDGEGTGCRVRARLLRAGGIYKVPATYLCPRMTGLTLSYSYGGHRQPPSHAYTRNGFEEREVTQALAGGGGLKAFHSREHGLRSMYIGFDAPACGSPLSIYFELENYSATPVDFTVEYLSAHGFAALEAEDHTDGFLGSGHLLLLVPGDMAKKRLYGYEGYFLRFASHSREHKEHALPRIKSIHMNMAKVRNANTVTEEFYLDGTGQGQEFRLSQGGLLELEVWANEKTAEGAGWRLWERGAGIRRGGRNYHADMGQGTVYLSQHALASHEFAGDDPAFKVRHAGYAGAQANLAAGTLDTLRGSVRYISGVSNPFPLYGGHGGHTEEGAARMVAGMLHTRNRAVTGRDFHCLIAQACPGVRKVKCVSSKGALAIAVLTEEYAEGTQAFAERKGAIRERLLGNSSLLPEGRELILAQPHFIRVDVRLWLEKEGMGQAYELQHGAAEAIREFLDPLCGGPDARGWEIGQFPRVPQVAAYLKGRLPGCSIARIVMTALEHGAEVPVNEDFYETRQDPFTMAVNGEHTVYIGLA